MPVTIRARDLEAGDVVGHMVNNLKMRRTVKSVGRVSNINGLVKVTYLYDDGRRGQSPLELPIIVENSSRDDPRAIKTQY